LRIVLLIVIGGAIVLVAGALALWCVRTNASAAPTMSAPVVAGDLTISVEGGGSVKPAHTVELPSPQQ
jgi:hypothetical protein